ncbi:MAG TPA: multifunctional CCA addition/repair protein [Gammaproteobacteria bacterium]|nr:multifunctional CCA addition/repair protein [Gammaproteobacteria bacterium]
MKIYLVGGAVRDQLLGKTVQDRDWVVVGGTAQDLIDRGYTQVGKDFPVFLHPETKEEYALARTERKSGVGYGGFEVYADPDVTLEEDLARRDLTINAMAMDSAGKVIDPFGGMADIRDLQLRHVRAAFSEDPLRVLRVARFKARFHHLGFQVNSATLRLMKAISDSGELAALAVERVWTEIRKSLMEETPSQFFLTLRACGALSQLLPELDNLFGVEQRKEYHPEIDAGVHTMMVVDQAASMQTALDVRFAALVHDLGKADTPPDVLPRHIGHEQKSVVRVRQVCERLKVPVHCRELAVLVARYHTQCHQVLSLKARTVLKLLEAIDSFRRPARLTKFLQACKADALGRQGAANETYQQLDYLSEAYRLSSQVKIASILETGVKGAEIRQALQQKRIQVIAELKRYQG